MAADGCLQRLDKHHPLVLPLILPAPLRGPVEREWVRSGALPAVLERMPSAAEVVRDPMKGPRRRMP